MAPELETVVIPRSADLGDGFTVKRALPAAARRMVGPFVFFDEMGPVAFGPGRGLDVRPHPHIGLATVTYLFDGVIDHRDSLGTVQPIRPGEVNWMTAGRGIVHSERTPPALRPAGSSLAGLQVWVALPHAREEDDPAFVHHGAGALPETGEPGVALKVVVGEIFGVRSPVAVASEMFYVDAVLAAGRRLHLPALHEERAAYVARGEVTVGADGQAFGAGQLLVFGRGREVVLAATRDARLMLFGGAPMDGPRFVWWNFVSSRKERIEQARDDWAAGRFPAVPGETEFIPLPAAKTGPVAYP
jgi:redox-sensitive bicupin YhaK (pirin superfamily)